MYILLLIHETPYCLQRFLKFFLTPNEKISTKQIVNLCFLLDFILYYDPTILRLLDLPLAYIKWNEMKHVSVQLILLISILVVC